MLLDNPKFINIYTIFFISFYLWKCKVVSEEHDTKKLDILTIADPKKHLPEAVSMPGDEVVPINNIAVWIDPLDATQEYTGKTRSSHLYAIMSVA